MSAADRRKIQRLEEELDEAEKAKKKLERERDKLKKDFEELTAKYDVRHPSCCPKA